MDRVISTRFPYLPIRLVVNRQAIEVEAFLDTGFDGDVVMPRPLMSTTASPDSYLYWALADGSSVRAPAYLGTVEMKPLGSFPVVVTILGDEPLIGRRLTDRFRVILDHGARVIVEP